MTSPIFKGTQSIVSKNTFSSLWRLVIKTVSLQILKYPATGTQTSKGKNNVLDQVKSYNIHFSAVAKSEWS